MKRKFIPFIIALSIFSFFTSCNEKEFDNALLWKISGNGLEKPSYIFGTHHMLPISYLDSIAGLKEALDNSEQVISEFLTTPEAMAEINKRMIEEAAFKQGESYRNLFSEEDYDKFTKSLFQIFGGESNYLGQLRPAMISIRLSEYIYSQVDSTYRSRDREPMDIYLQRVAREAGKVTLGLETPQERINLLFNTKSDKEQSQDLLCALESIELNKKFVEDINRLYKEKSLTKLYKLFHDKEDFPCEFRSRLILENSEKSTIKQQEQLEKELKKRSSLVVVGSYRLLGPGSLLCQFAQRGYHVEAMH